MTCRPLIVLAVAAAVGVAAGPAHAAAHKPKPSSGSYTVSAPPDPTMDVEAQLKKECTGVNPASHPEHPFTVPGPGTLHVVLDSKNVASKTDWDLWIMGPDGSAIDGSHGPTSHEETTDTFKKAQSVVFKACNIAGAPTATVTWTFTPKK